MEILHPRCCGLDVHKKSITACVITPKGKEVRTFSTMTHNILELIDWIVSYGCSSVAMESTGVFWIPVYNLLELQDIEVLVVNAQHIKAVPGRKTDVKDAEWIADLLRHGLLKGSYIPDRNQRELRELVRYRKSLIEERSREINRLQKVLEGCNIKLASVASSVVGVSGRAMIEALINGLTDPKLLAELAQGNLRKKIDQLEHALLGLVGPHQKMLLSAQLRHIDFLDQQIALLDQEIGGRLRPFDFELDLLDTIPGIGRQTAELILAEIGTDMGRFRTDANLSSWAGMTPGNNESAGKRKSSKAKKGNRHLRSALVRAAHAAANQKDCYLSNQYHRLASRRGGNRAAVAVGHSILVIVYHILKDCQPYVDLGPNYYDQRKEAYIIKNSIKRIEALGYKVNLEEVSA